MTPILQIAWAHAVPRAWDAISGKDVLCASGTCVAALLLLCFSTPLNDPLYSLIPLGSLCLLSPSRRWLDPESESAPDPAPKQSVGAPFALLGGIACALAGSHVFNGAAEIGPSLQQPPIFVGIFTALALFALLQRLSPNHRADVTATATASVLAILLSIAIQGLTSETTGATSSVAAQILHAIVLTCEYLIYLLGRGTAPARHIVGHPLRALPCGTPRHPRRAALLIRAGARALRAGARGLPPVGVGASARLHRRRALHLEEHREDACRAHLQEDRDGQPRGAHPARRATLGARGCAGWARMRLCGLTGV